MYLHTYIQAKRFIDPPIKEPFGLQIFSLQVSSFESTVNCTLHLPLFFSRLALHKYGEMDILTLFVARPVLSIRIFLPIMTILLQSSNLGFLKLLQCLLGFTRFVYYFWHLSNAQIMKLKTTIIVYV